MSFKNIMILLLLCIILFLYMYKNKNVNEKYTINDMNISESDRVMKECEFSLDCCPSLYSNDRGCMCMDKQVSEVLSTRGYNKTHTDGFGY